MSSFAAVTTNAGMCMLELRTWSSDDERGAIRQSASMPCDIRWSRATLGPSGSSSPTVAEVTEYPAARAARSSPRSVLFGPYSTALSTITPIRLVFLVASARAAWFGR